LQQVYLPL